MPSGQDRHDTPHCMSRYEYVYVQYVQALNDECVGKTTQRFWAGSMTFFVEGDMPPAVFTQTNQQRCANVGKFQSH